MYGDDRVFVVVGLDGEMVDEERLAALAAAGHPVIRHELAEPYDIGGEFLRWELATAVAGAVLGIDPFDQPNVQESKDNTKALLKVYAEAGELPDEAADGGRFAYPVHDDGLGAALGALLERAAPGEYLAIQAFVKPDPAVWDALQRDPRRAARPPAHRHDPGLRAALPALDRASSTRAARGAVCSCRSSGTTPTTWRSPDSRTRSACSSGRRRAATSPRCGPAASPGLRVCLGDDVGAGLERLAALVAGA